MRADARGSPLGCGAKLFEGRACVLWQRCGWKIHWNFGDRLKCSCGGPRSPSKLEVSPQCESRFGRGIVGVWPGRVAERLMATGCKPVAPWSYGGSNPPPSTKFSQSFCREAVVAQLVERVLGKDEVTGSTPVNGSRFSRAAAGAS